MIHNQIGKNLLKYYIYLHYGVMARVNQISLFILSYLEIYYIFGIQNL